MIQQTAPMTLLELVDRIKEKSNDTLLSTISANGGKAEIKSIAPLETAGHGEMCIRDRVHRVCGNGEFQR